MERKIFLATAVLVVLGLTTIAMALPPMGPPTAGLNKGQFRFGVEYAYSDLDMDAEDATIDGVTSNMFFANLGYGIMDDWEGYVRLGVANVDVEDFSGDYGFAWGFGTKVTFLKQEKLNWGALFQMTWTDSEDEDIEFDFYDMQIAVGPTWKLNDKLSIYGGPFLHFINGDIKDDVIDEDGNNGSADLEEDSQFGGYVGAEAALSDTTSLFGEVQFTGAGWGIGTGISWKF